MKELIFHSPDEASTFWLGRRMGEMLEPGDVLALWGDLGAGKTFFTRALARGLGIPPEVPVTSATFTFINEYDGRLHLYHLDLYRLGDLDEIDTLPWREALFGEGVAAVEWPERLDRYLPEERLDIRIDITGDESRTITITARGDKYLPRMVLWAASLGTGPSGPVGME